MITSIWNSVMMGYMYLGRGSSWSREGGTGCEHQLGSLLSDTLYRIFFIEFFALALIYRTWLTVWASTGEFVIGYLLSDILQNYILYRPGAPAGDTFILAIICWTLQKISILDLLWSSDMQVTCWEQGWHFPPLNELTLAAEVELGITWGQL